MGANFDEIKAKGAEDIFFLSMNIVSGLESGVKVIFPQTKDRIIKYLE